MIIIKECNICKEIKPLDEFYQYEKESKTKGKFIYIQPYCKVCNRTKNEKWKMNNPEKRKESIRKDNARPEKKKQVLEANRKYRKKGKLREWQQDNKDKVKEYQIHREQHKTHDISISERESCKEYFNYSCAYCDITEVDAVKVYGQRLHMDHAENFGANDLSNSIPACKACNSSKGTEDLKEWFTHKDFYSDEKLQTIHNWLDRDYLLYIEKITIK